MRLIGTAAERREDPLRIVRSDVIHQRMKYFFGIIFAQIFHNICKNRGVTALNKIDDGAAKRIIHHPVEHASQDIIPPPAVAYFI